MNHIKLTKSNARIAIYIVLTLVVIIFNAEHYERFLNDWYLRFKTRNQNIVLTLTTTPARINNIQTTLDTILAQKGGYSALYLCVPKTLRRTGEEYVIPSWLQHEKRIKIIRTKDYGPGTKLLGLLEQVKLPPNTIIITLDDDVYYPDNLVLQLAYRSMLNPNNSVGISGVDLDYDINGNVNTSTYMGLIQKYEENFVNVLQGYAGIAYRPSFFKPDIFELENAPEACILSDDIYFAHYLARYNVPRRMLKNKLISVYDIKWVNDIGTGYDALHKQNPPAYKHKDCVTYLKQTYPNVVF